ncbi:hypothetical protein [Bradyrhizobium tropiciagri]|uniref:hypothetical protein n=1 Tax=Bradyrhizobium tropiciagri TaxID=312253 RepID=UPI00067C9294|nr:hypothetical protein [Bradyrhizobium tropiciagri]
MTGAADKYAIYYGDKLWRLMPAVYRTLDTDQYDVPGPLREIVNRIGVSAAEVRRNIDRLWDDQSIESCDDWVIPYIADLVDTRLVSGLDAASQRRDVANTIDYRRRKGTLSVIEQIVHDITQWDVKAVEFFRRLARTRHGLDPAIWMGSEPGDRALAQAEGLVGPQTATPIGGFANLRNVVGAVKAGTPFDEFFHFADTRAGQGDFGWYAIPHLGLFVWRLKSFLVGPVTPVPVNSCPGWFCFDPTGRDIALFCAGAATFGDAWTSPTEAQVPGPMSQALLAAEIQTATVQGGNQTGARLKTTGWGDNAADLPDVGDTLTIEGVNAVNSQTHADTGAQQVFTVTAPLIVDIDGSGMLTLYPPITVGGAGATVVASPADGAQISRAGAVPDPLYPGALAVFPPPASPPQSPTIPPIAPMDLKLRPQRGRFHVAGGHGVTAKYSYGFPSEIGAGPYNRLGQTTRIDTPGSESLISGGGPNLVARLAAIATLTLKDSLTYDAPSAPVQVTALTLRADNRQRPLVRLATGGRMIFVGASADAALTLDGLFVSGGDIVLKGQFATVTLACCTLDPGNPASSPPTSPPSSPPSPYALSADGRPLVPTRLVIEAAIGTLKVDRCVLGPVRAREVDPKDPTPIPQAVGNVENAILSNSILQAIESKRSTVLDASAVYDPLRLMRLLQLAMDPVAVHLRQLRPKLVTVLGALASPPTATPPPPLSLLPAVLAEINAIIAGPSIYDRAFAHVPLSERTLQLLKTQDKASSASGLNRALLEDAFPLELAEAALAFGDGMLDVSRCTVLGRVVAHRLEASECILQQMTTADDLQDSCVRFSALTSLSRAPRQYQCVLIPDGAPLFTSTEFGQPGFAQLLPTADLRRLPDTNPNGGPQNTISAGAVDGSEMGAYARDRNPIRGRALLLKMQEYMPAGLTPVIINVT